MHMRQEGGPSGSSRTDRDAFEVASHVSQGAGDAQLHKGGHSGISRWRSRMVALIVFFALAVPMLWGVNSVFGGYPLIGVRVLIADIPAFRIGPLHVNPAALAPRGFHAVAEVEIPPCAGTIHIAQPGESIWRVARGRRHSPPKVVKTNEVYFDDTDLIHPGEKVCLSP